MKHTHTKAVAVPMDEALLEALVARKESLTALAYGKPGDVRPMAGPRRILAEDQAHLPVLFSPARPDGTKVTHAAVCGLVVPRPEVPARATDWFDKRRAERHAGTD